MHPVPNGGRLHRLPVATPSGGGATHADLDLIRPSRTHHHGGGDHHRRVLVLHKTTSTGEKNATRKSEKQIGNLYSVLIALAHVL